MASTFGGLGAVDPFGLRGVDEVEELVDVPVIYGARYSWVQVLPLRQLLLTASQPGAQLLSDLRVVPACRSCRRLREDIFTGPLAPSEKSEVTHGLNTLRSFKVCVSYLDKVYLRAELTAQMKLGQGDK